MAERVEVEQQASDAEVLSDDVAERTEGIAAAAFGVDGRAIMDAWGTIFSQATRQPRALFEAGLSFSQEIGSILMGSSELAPEPTDKRFKDAEWLEHPLYRRLGQSYVAWSNALDQWLDASGLESIERERARFVLDIAKDVLAPVNTLLGNPAAVRKLRESNGSSLARGLRNLIDDLQHNHGYPAVADRHALVVGTDVAATPGAVVYRNELFELIQYTPTTEQVTTIPLLYVFSQVNRFYLGDLTPDRSLFQRLLHAGIPLFAISWRNPTTNERDWNLDTYADGALEAIRVMQQITDQPKIHLMGLCAGGLVAAAAAGVLEARGENSIDTLSLFVNVLDYRQGDSEFGLFITERSVAAQKAMVRGRGVFSERDVFEMFALLRMEDNVMSFFRSNYLLGEDPPQHPLLFWSMDYTRVPAEMQCDFVDLGQDNKLAKKEMRILGKRVDLSGIDYPVYVMAGSTDHITPWKACYRSTQLFSGDVTFVLTNQNHTQTISSRADNKHLKYWVAKDLPADPETAVASADEHPGPWTGHWLLWLTARSADKVDAPQSLGSSKHPVLGDAPGQYVLES
jgi:polyhydroxyalkanoate synthase